MTKPENGSAVVIKCGQIASDASQIQGAALQNYYRRGASIFLCHAGSYSAYV